LSITFKKEDQPRIFNETKFPTLEKETANALEVATQTHAQRKTSTQSTTLNPFFYAMIQINI